MLIVSDRVSVRYSRESLSWPCIFTAGGVGQTNEFSQFKGDSICLPMVPHCGSFGSRLRKPLPHAKLRDTNLKIGTCRVNFLV